MTRRAAPARTVVLDGEAVQALTEPTHPHHRRAVAHLQVVATRKHRGQTIAPVVPTAVRVEAGVDRRAPTAAFFNGLRVADRGLDRVAADHAAALVARFRVSVADAHIGAVVAAADTEAVTVITRDPRDMRRVAGGRPVTVVRL